MEEDQHDQCYQQDSQQEVALDGIGRSKGKIGSVVGDDHFQVDVFVHLFHLDYLFSDVFAHLHLVAVGLLVNVNSQRIHPVDTVDVFGFLFGIEHIGNITKFDGASVAIDAHDQFFQRFHIGELTCQADDDLFVVALYFTRGEIDIGGRHCLRNLQNGNAAGLHLFVIDTDTDLAFLASYQFHLGNTLLGREHGAQLLLYNVV